MSRPSLRPFRPEDYAAARALWLGTEGVNLSPGDEEAEVRAFLARNEGLSLVAVDGDALVAAVLCGHDGRRGFIYHLAVAACQHGNLEAEFADAAAHAIHDGVVLAGITSVEDEAVNRPDVDLEWLR